MKIKKKLYVFTLFAVLCGCFFYAPGRACAKEPVKQNQEAYLSSGFVCNNAELPGDITEPIEKGKSLFAYFIDVIGWIFIVLGFVFLGLSFVSHQMDQRIMGLIGIFIGFFISVAPRIAEWITGS